MNDSDLYDIAARAGLERGFRSAHGEHVDTPPHAIAAVLQSLGYDVSSDAKRAETLAVLKGDEKTLVDPTVPVEAGHTSVVPVNVQGGDLAWTITLEDGGTREGRSDVWTEHGHSRIEFAALPEGYHQLEIEGHGRVARATLIAAPRTCYLPERLKGDARGYGVTAQVYGLRSAANFGIGDFSDVADLGEGAGRFGAAFLGLSPLHALFPSDRSKISPYSPSSRLFIDPIFIDPTILPDFATSDAARYLAQPEIAAELDRLRAIDLVEHAASWAIKRTALDKYWAVFATTADPKFAAYRAEAGAPLELHATFEALCEHFAARGKMWSGAWPPGYDDPQGEAVRQFRQEFPQQIAFHAWLQWLADSQLAAAQARALASGMAIGVYRDLAVGVDAGGAEMWARPDWFVKSLSVGAPPDLLGPSGQNWGLPPFNPRTLVEQGLQAFRTLVSSNMRHAGAIRIDHAFQLQRLYVVPDGLPATEGVYINYPFEAMLAVLRLESHRARSLVIAEDLGTAPEGFSDAIMRSDILSYRIVTFEREPDGGFKPPWAYPRKALAAIATHDLPTFASWWLGLDADVRQSFGLITSDQAAEAAKDRAGERSKFCRALADARITPSDAVPTDPPFEAAFRYVAKAPSMLAALQLEDVLEDTNQANMPGPDVGHPNWRRKLTRTVDGILAPGGLLAQASEVTLSEGRSLAPEIACPPAAPPTSTYRLQFHKDFTFAHATKALPYLESLGISHVYASPILKARPGSTHGYDTVDPTQINPELGGLDGFETFAAAIKARGMELLLDIVPNHMGVGGADNPWWLSMLEWGELSPFVDTFDIDWERLGAHGNVVAPFLGGQYGETLEKGDLKLTFDRTDGSFSVMHYEHRFPICPLTYPDILDRAVAVDAGDGTYGIDGLLRISEELRALSQEPPHRRAGIVETCEMLKHRLALLARRGTIVEAIEQAIEVINGTPGLPESFGTLHRLLERQAYRLAFWRVAASDVNYRRFFDIDGLAGVRIEKPVVFEETHALIFDLVRRGLVQGLRIDHIDGLADPKAYAADLQTAIGPNFYVVAEKILEPGEVLRPWALSGTTGYEMLNLLDGVFVDGDNERTFDRIYRETTGFSQSYEDALLSAKQQVLLESFSSELESLVSDMKRIADANRLTRDYSVNSIRIALGDLICAFPVYRTYITPRVLESEDRVLLGKVLEDAKRLTALPDSSVHDFIGAVLLGTLPMGRPGQAREGIVRRFLRRFQQLTGPVMAKSLEDTLFYRYARFLALNEVGGEPSRFGIPVNDFHAENKERAKTWPLALTASATHDTKRGEDARARLLALSEAPDLWAQALAVWKAEAGSSTEPDAIDQYMFLQAVLGVWPIELLEHEDSEVLTELRERLAAYVPKALREAKRHSKWIAPNEQYERATIDLLDRLLANGSRFIERIRPIMQDLAKRGMLISLARTVLKCTVPGVPDFYQGTALWDFSLVDPDNRRPVDYTERVEALNDGETLTHVLARWKDGAIKLRLSSALLQDRRSHAVFYAKAGYQQLGVTGPRWANVIAFARRHQQAWLVVIVPRLSGGGAASATMPVGAGYWGPTSVDLPAGTWVDLFEGRRHQSNGAISLGALCETLPFAVLRNEA